MALPRPEVFYTDDFMFDVLGIEELPTTLYQYTSLESLEMILSNKTLKLSRLDNVNDPEEALASDLKNASSSVFVSCWSSDPKESIPMWSMYGDSGAGVRIGLPSNMFIGRHFPTIWEEGGATTNFDEEVKIPRREPAMSSRMWAVIGPNKIYYSDDPAFRKRQLIHRSGGIANYIPYDLGMVKGQHWEYEQEWRYKISAISFESQYPDNEYFNDVLIDFEKYPVETEALFISLDPSSFDEMEVTIGPKANLNAVQSILADKAPLASIKPSDIAMR